MKFILHGELAPATSAPLRRNKCKIDITPLNPSEVSNLNNFTFYPQTAFMYFITSHNMQRECLRAGSCSAAYLRVFTFQVLNNLRILLSG
jgi:hypothetical protein